MARRVDDLNEMERGTGLVISRAVGERLRASLPPETTALPPRLQYLLDELRRNDPDEPRPR